MAQYCRYCAEMVCGNGNYCYVRSRTYSDKHIKRANTCPYFRLNKMDALFENIKGYEPREKTFKNIGQLEL